MVSSLLSILFLLLLSLLKSNPSLGEYDGSRRRHLHIRYNNAIADMENSVLVGFRHRHHHWPSSKARIVVVVVEDEDERPLLDRRRKKIDLDELVVDPMSQPEANQYSNSESSFSSSIPELQLSLPFVQGQFEEDYVDESEQHQQQQQPIPKHLLRSTGTTIAGLVINSDPEETGSSSFVILGADTRSTDATLVADTFADKIHSFIDNQLYACGAGTAADLNAMAKQFHAQLKLQQLQYHDTIGNDEYTNPSVISFSKTCRMVQDMLWRAGGNLGVNWIVGGMEYDQEEKKEVARLVAIHPHGSMDQHVPYLALGSGGLAAMAVLESRYNNRGGIQSLEEGIQLIVKAIEAGIRNDLGSGGRMIQLCILGPNQYCRREQVEISLLGGRDDRYSNDKKEQMEPQEEASMTAPTAATVGGVNGFGNLQYQELSRRVVLLDDDNDDDDDSLWNQRIFPK